MEAVARFSRASIQMTQDMVDGIVDHVDSMIGGPVPPEADRDRETDDEPDEDAEQICGSDKHDQHAAANTTNGAAGVATSGDRDDRRGPRDENERRSRDERRKRATLIAEDEVIVSTSAPPGVEKRMSIRSEARARAERARAEQQTYPSKTGSRQSWAAETSTSKTKDSLPRKIAGGSEKSSTSEHGRGASRRSSSGRGNEEENVLSPAGARSSSAETGGRKSVVILDPAASRAERRRASAVVGAKSSSKENDSDHAGDAAAKVDRSSDRRGAVVGEPAGKQVEMRDLREKYKWNYSDSDKDVSAYNPTYWLPMTLKIATNTVGLAGISLAYGLGNVQKAITGNSLADNPTIKMSIVSWLRLNGVTVTTRLPPGETLDDLASSPFIICNHISYIDGPILATELNYPKIMAKSGMKTAPVVGPWMDDLGCIWVDRFTPEGRQAAIDALDEHAKTWTKGEKPLLVFPEGGTSAGATVAEFRRGCFTSGLPVRPVILMYTGSTDLSVPHWKKDGDELREFTDADWMANFLGSGFTNVLLKVCRVHHPDEAEKSDPNLYAKRMWELIKYEYERLRRKHHEYTEQRRDQLENYGLGWMVDRADLPESRAVNEQDESSAYRNWTEEEMAKYRSDMVDRKRRATIAAGGIPNLAEKSGVVVNSAQRNRPGQRATIAGLPGGTPSTMSAAGESSEAGSTTGMSTPIMHEVEVPSSTTRLDMKRASVPAGGSARLAAADSSAASSSRPLKGPPPDNDKSAGPRSVAFAKDVGPENSEGTNGRQNGRFAPPPRRVRNSVAGEDPDYFQNFFTEAENRQKVTDEERHEIQRELIAMQRAEVARRARKQAEQRASPNQSSSSSKEKDLDDSASASAGSKDEPFLEGGDKTTTKRDSSDNLTFSPPGAADRDKGAAASPVSVWVKEPPNANPRGDLDFRNSMDGTSTAATGVSRDQQGSSVVGATGEAPSSRERDKGKVVVVPATGAPSPPSPKSVARQSLGGGKPAAKIQADS